MSAAPLSLKETFAGKRILLTGATGFLGKVVLEMLLRRHPEVARVDLLARGKKGRTAAERLEAEVLPSRVFDPLREQLGPEAFADLWDAKVRALHGDSSEKMFGLDAAGLGALSGVDVVIHCAGLTDFTPPLDEACRSNAWGALNAIELAHAIGACNVHISTCYVAGAHDGLVMEDLDPVGFYPNAKEHAAPFDAEVELNDLARFISRAAEDALDQEHEAVFLEEARKRLATQGRDPNDPEAQAVEVEKQRKRYAARQLRDEGMRRASHWGWPNTYTYSKSMGEQLVAKRMALGRDAICRPAIIESSLAEPFPGWNEGINTSAPLTYLAWKGHRFYPSTPTTRLDVVPVDVCASGILLVAAACLRGEAKRVYQLASSDCNPVTVRRVIELMDLANREQYRKRSSWESMVLMQLETVTVSKQRYDTFSAPGVRAMAKAATSFLEALPVRRLGPLGLAASQAKKALKTVEKFTDRTDRMVSVFLPFIHDYEYRFSSKNGLELSARLIPAEAAYAYAPDKIDWRHYLLKVQFPGLHKWIFPELEAKLKESEERPMTGPMDLLELLDAAAALHPDRTAFKRLVPGSVELVTYSQFKARVDLAAHGLQELGAGRGARVAVLSENRPEWPIAYFAVLRAGGTVVPVDAQADLARVENICAAYDVKVAVVSKRAEERLARESNGSGKVQAHKLGGVRLASLEALTSPDAKPLARGELVRRQGPDAVASIIATSGTTGKPKGVQLSHKNFTSQVQAMQRVFDLSPRDTLLSVLPLHHTFEFTCGLLLPLSRGSTITYIDEVNGELLSRALREEKITCIIGVPALWQLLHRRIRTQAAERSDGFAKGFDRAIDLAAWLRDRARVNVGPLAFAPIHERLGGHLRYLVSGGAALPKDVWQFYRGLGLKLYEGYGLTEAAPVIAVGRPGARQTAGSVGTPLPGVELKILNPDEHGVGEVLARGPNIMLGYEGDAEATALAIRDGWLHTGDLGKLDKGGRLQLVGRDKDVIVEASGKNVYPDELEEVYAGGPYVKELCIAGAPDGAGGERVACLVVPDYEAAKKDGLDRAATQGKLRDWFRDRGATLQAWQKVKVLRFWDRELPQTSTRKVKRSAVKQELARLAAMDDKARQLPASASASDWLHRLVASVSGRAVEEVRPESRLLEELGFDSLMAIELASAIEQRSGVSLSEDDLARLTTVAELEARVKAAAPKTLQRAESKALELAKPAAAAADDFAVPQPVRRAVMTFLDRGQKSVYDNLFDVEIFGKGNIPYNQQTLVIANHTSHLDMGLVKHALRDYAPKLAALAARDYFFGPRARRLFFENFTNVIPMDRAGSEESLNLAGDKLRQGEIVLLFPEGTRSADGKLQEFRRGLGWLVMKNKIDVLPVYLDGAYRAIPKGKVIPRSRKLAVHIGPVLSHAFFLEKTKGLARRPMYEEVSRLSREAVLALKERRPPEWVAVKAVGNGAAKLAGDDLLELFGELCGRYVPGKAERKLSYYFTLGPGENEKFTVRVDEQGAHFHAGKPSNADCVVKTTPGVLRKIVRQGQMPSLDDFASGAVKTSDGNLLISFQQIFGL